MQKNFGLGKRLPTSYAYEDFMAFEFSVAGADRHYGVAVVANGRLEYLSLLHPEGEIIEAN